jgi:hypothetical protein
MRDLRAWWRQVRVGGVMAGHDLNMRGESRTGTQAKYISDIY